MSTSDSLDEETQAILIAAGIALVALLITHYVFGRTVTHAIIAGLGLVALALSNRHFNEEEKKERARLESIRLAEEEENERRRREKIRRDEERKKTILESAEQKAITYIADMRRATLRLDGTDKNATKVAMAIDEILTNISSDPEIDRKILEKESVMEESNIVREALENSLLKDHLVKRRFEKIL